MNRKEEQKEILEKLEEIWTKYPEFRFCQLIYCVLEDKLGFYTSDVLFLEKLKKCLIKLSKK